MAKRREAPAGARRDQGKQEERAADPVGFVERELGAPLWEKQAEILEALRDCKRVAVRSCNGSGKTYAAAYAVLWWLVSRPGMAITTAPTERQVREVLWREIRRAYRGNERLIGGTLNRTSLEIGDKHYAQGVSTNLPDRFQGFHQGDILFVVDEASGVAEDIFDAIEGSMTSAGAKLLLLGNPSSPSGTFYNAFHRGRGLWRTIHISAFDTPNLQAGEVVTPGLVTSEWVEEATENWGEESPVYQVRVLGEFPRTADDTLISLKHIEAAVERGRSLRGALPEGSVDAPVEMGVDVARFGSDRTVICVRQGDAVLEMESFSGLDTMSTAGRVMDAARRHSPERVRVDEVGLGAGVLDRLRENGLKGVSGVNVAQAARRRESFANLRAELYDGLRERLQQGRMALKDDEALAGELASIKYSFTSSGQLRLESKEDMRSRGLPSPDRADALMLAFAERRERGGYKLWA
ncbi:MAG: hypothetical protein ACOC5K_00335 [Chloroflexota bacterium]